MKEANRWLMLGALALAFSIVGCDCGGDGAKPPEETPDAGTGDDGGVTPPPDAGPGSQCLVEAASCSRTSGSQCCTGVCGDDGRCPPPNVLCRSSGEVCQSGGDCCTNICDNGKCASQLCRDVGQACTGAEECCTKTCTGGVCADIPGSSSQCKVLGQACASGADCCSTNCQGGLCTRAYSCKAYGDVCQGNAECCGNACSAGDGGVGRCEFITGGGGGGCRQDGNPCSDGSTCCSRTCVDLGYGSKVCQPVGGCKLTGNACSGANDCCGGGVNPNGSVMCAGGRCDNGSACNGVGNICGSGKLPDGGTTDINASQNCCDGKKAVCKVDSSGVPRCFGGGGIQGCSTGYTGTPPCCISDSQTCQFSDQCCNGALCLPNGSGGLTCQRPLCSPLGASCNRGADGGSACCTGTACLKIDELNSACQQPRPPGGSDGGTGGADGGGGTDAGPTCKANETSCSTPSQCCSGICTGGLCKPPSLCQPQSGACTSGADCCQGLRCEVPSGVSSGTCQVGATCSASGQACSATTACCTGLLCEGVNTGTTCNGTEPCGCTVIIN